MAEGENNKTVSKINPVFPEYLDFTKLRTAAIEYIGKLSGKIWTDHNVHDPGITILESLIYALLDLGYRTNLPAGDLFTRDPADKASDNNFFTASRILGNNPLTITDYRKLLIDIEGVKNAWLEVDDNLPVDFCPEKVEQPNPEPPGQVILAAVRENGCECTNLNGLYHVYIQLEEEIDQKKHLHEKTIRKIRQSLMGHRNLCEDFLDIKILCKLELGICAEIDLEPDADAEDVYVKMVEALKEFFSPSPKFYSLQQLLDKNRPIDEIFAGRPFNITESHGFVDTEEFENLKLRKELHLSDVYHLLSDIAGVRRIRNLGWIKCCTDKETSKEWNLILPDNYIPSFSPACSGFIFTRRGLPEKVDLKKFESYFEMKFTGLKKGLYKEPSAFLDPVLPRGVYRNDLADYYSIQNDFPDVYGIKEGGLSAKAKDERKAQALQLQGFLLFFDQLLANYLTQLKNIRSLFSLTSSDSSSHTYFINQLVNAPQLNRLLRFNIDSEGNNPLGAQGSILAYPTGRKKLETDIENGKLKNADPCDYNFPEYLFCFAEERNLALNQLRDDLLYGNYEPVIASNPNDCYFFYFLTASSDVALISKHFYPDQKLAASAAASVKYSASFPENYRSYMTEKKTGEERFSFDIELNLDVYSKYLQLIVEDKQLYLKRRQEFLSHLLARFAETFTDFALLSSPFTSSAELPALRIKTGERFLSHYDDISSNRGKAYDYLKNRWNSSNISGFEKRVKSLAGIDNWNRHFLCNFIVEPADKLYRLSIRLFDMVFSVTEKTFNEKNGLDSLLSIYKKLGSPVFEYDFISHKQKYQLFIRDDFGNRYRLENQDFDEKEVTRKIDNLGAAFKFQPDLSNDIKVSKYIHKVLFTDSFNKTIAESRHHFIEKQDAESFGVKSAGKLVSYLKDENEFVRIGRPHRIDKLIPVTVDSFPYVFINENEFVWRPVEVFHLKEKRLRFSVLNKKSSFQFDSTNDFPNTRTARESYRSVLPMLAKASSYLIEKNKQTDKYEILISDGSQKIAKFVDSFDTDVSAGLKKKELLNETDTYTFRLIVTEQLADEWEFKYSSGDENGNSVDYISRGNYKSSELATKAAINFHANLPDLRHRMTEGELHLELKKNKLNIITVAQPGKPDTEEQKRAQSILVSRKRLYEDISNSSRKNLLSLLHENRINPGEDFIYKLVDKDNLLAYYTGDESPVSRKDAEDLRDKIIPEALKGYNYVDIAKGADVIMTRKDEKTKITWYHYLIKCNNRKYKNGPLAGKDLIMFESTRGYKTHDEAYDAFQAEYLEILKYARNVKNYGKDQKISLVELFVLTSDPCDNKKSKVFVPRETSVELGDYEVQNILAPMAASYPIRFLRKKKYIFILGMLDEKTNTFTSEWKSVKEFTSASDAMERLQFFLVLLKYPGNFYIEWSSVYGEFRVYIREVLAISAHGFASSELAWGEDGVEKLICVSQSKNGFHNYINKLTCNPGFFVACGNTGLRHPCTYDTPSRRDQVLNKLSYASRFIFPDLVRDITDNEIVLTDLQKKPLVRININPPVEELKYNVCEWLLLFMESVYKEKNYIRKDGVISLIHRYQTSGNKEAYYNIAEPYDKKQNDLRKWKLELQQIACYFPVRRAENQCTPGGEDKYTIEIKLPDFDPCCRDIKCDDPCRRSFKGPDCTGSCNIAWITDCCFETCCEALTYYISSIKFLKGIENYKPVFDCNCGSYGIELHSQLTLKEREDYIKSTVESLKDNIICSRSREYKFNRYQNRFQFENLCLSEIIAINPQLYTNPEMVCDAVKRSKKLINSEGLHLVEHILLRPRCKDDNGNYEECGCKGLPRPCIDVNLCQFQWKPGGDPDPCESKKTVCLTPGCDPYSFIATVILPAWPERFRSESGRKIMEKLLQREAPAHVLLRIMWLRPLDFCCLELYYKLWMEWLAKKHPDQPDTNCEFLTLLFEKEYAGLTDCNECIPCGCDDKQINTCSPEVQDPCEKYSVLSRINELFCWSHNQNLKPIACDILQTGYITKKSQKTIPKESINVTEVISAPPDRIKEVSRLGQSRAHRYELNINQIKEVNQKNEIISRAIVFLKNRNPKPDEYTRLAEAVIKDKSNAAKGIKELNKNQKQAVIENITWKYLDSVCIIGKDLEMIGLLQEKFRMLSGKGVDMKTLYEGWEGGKLAEFEPDIDYKKIKKWLLGR